MASYEYGGLAWRRHTMASLRPGVNNWRVDIDENISCA
jgi:hypothetical protein